MSTSEILLMCLMLAAFLVVIGCFFIFEVEFFIIGLVVILSGIALCAFGVIYFNVMVQKMLKERDILKETIVIDDVEYNIYPISSSNDEIFKKFFSLDDQLFYSTENRMIFCYKEKSNSKVVPYKYYTLSDYYYSPVYYIDGKLVMNETDKHYREVEENNDNSYTPIIIPYIPHD